MRTNQNDAELLEETYRKLYRVCQLNRKLREPNWHFESIREMQRELVSIEDSVLIDKTVEEWGKQ